MVKKHLKKKKGKTDVSAGRVDVKITLTSLH